MKKRDELLKGYNDRYSLFGLLFAFGNRLQTTGDTFYEEITCKQFFFLICLKLFRREPPTINDLSEVMGCSHQNVKQIALKLEKKGLIRLEVDESDKRKLRVISEPLLRELADKYLDKEKAFMLHLFEGIEDRDISTTYQVMLRMEKNLIRVKEINE